MLPFMAALAGCTTIPERPAGIAEAWATFDHSGITASNAAGLADRAADRPLTIDDPVRIASISKLVVALGVMRLVEAGTLDLDRDVSDWLGWRLRNPAFPDAPITLRLLLSHRSSLTDAADYAIPLGGSLRATIADSRAFDAAHAPGSHFRYANLNFPVIASVMERAAGERFDRLMARLVLSPLALDACFNWTTCSDAATARAVVLYTAGGSVLRDDLNGRRPDCPVFVRDGAACDLAGYTPGDNGALFAPQGGLRISVRDLVTIGRLLAGRGAVDGRRFLSAASIATITAPAWRYDGANGESEAGFYCTYGLAVQALPTATPGCHDDLFRGRHMIGHAGEAYGLRSGLWVDPASGKGIAYFAINNGDDPPKGRTAFRAIEEELAGKLKR